MDGLIDLLDSTVASFLADGKSEDQATITTMRLNLHGLVNSLIEVGQTGEDMPNAQLALLVSGLLDTLSWITARDMARDAWQEIEIFANEDNGNGFEIGDGI